MVDTKCQGCRTLLKKEDMTVYEQNEGKISKYHKIMEFMYT